MAKWVNEVLHDPALQQYRPQRPWQAAQIEEHLLFLHYRFHPDGLRALVPPALDLVTYDGSAWVALIAFHMADVRLRMLPLPMPRSWRSGGEIDLAVPVRHRGRHGMYFLSIEGANRFTSWVTRRSSGLPYLHSPNLTVHAEGNGFRAVSGPRWVRGRAAAEFDAHYARWQPAQVPDPGSPVELLTGQYSAFTLHRGHVCELDEIHQLWELHEAEVEMRQNTLLDAAGIGGRQPELQHYSPGRKIVSWLPAPVGANRTGLAPADPVNH